MNRRYFLRGMILLPVFSLAQLLPARTIDILVPSPTPTPSETPVIQGWSLMDKLLEKEDEFQQMPVKVWPIFHTFTEMRSGYERDFVRAEKRVALKLLNTVTGEVTLTSMLMRGDLLIPEEPYMIQANTRDSGIRINSWATEHLVIEPENLVVIRVKYPSETIRCKGYPGIVDNALCPRKRLYISNVQEISYNPHNPEIHRLWGRELSAKGEEYLKDLAQRAFEYLKERKVASRAFPGYLVSDLVDMGYLNPDMFYRLAMIEHTDVDEIAKNPIYYFDRHKIEVALNPGLAKSFTVSSAGAGGLMQYTRKTWDSIGRKLYKRAQLPTFAVGAKDHFYSMVAAILLHDNNLGFLPKKYHGRPDNVDSLEEYLAGMYNTAPTRVTKTLGASILSSVADWISFEPRGNASGYLLDETKGYIVKLRKLRELETAVAQNRP